MSDPIVKAKIEYGEVVESFLVWDIPEHLKDWITAPVEVGPGWIYENGIFTEPTIKG